MKLRLPVLLFHQQHDDKYTAPFNAILNNALLLLEVILNICDFKVTNTTVG
jgi:hypothetical protein